MLELIVIGVLYVLALGFFWMLGGWGAAGDALRSWGSHHSHIRMNPGSSS